jgi:hypothetical protein
VENMKNETLEQKRLNAFNEQLAEKMKKALKKEHGGYITPLPKIVTVFQTETLRFE